MEKLSTILENRDLDEMQFYLDYLDVLIDFFEGRKMNIDELYEEKRILEAKIKEINQ